jgi:hypothetical protein
MGGESSVSYKDDRLRKDYVEVSVDLNEERAQFAQEAAAVARSLSRLADLSEILDRGTVEVGVDDLNSMAARVHRWAVAVALDVSRPELIEDIERRERAFADWRELQARLRSRAPLTDS